MKNNLKKLLCAALSVAMVAGTVILPTTASADEYTPIFAGDTVLKEWKFDFGAEGATPEDGFTLVTPNTNFTANNEGEYQYGFLGTDPEDHNLTNRYDGWKTQKGQTIELAAGNDAIGVVGAGGTEEKGGVGNDIFGNQADKYYPVRFAMKVQDDTYYRIRATVTTLDPEKPATASLYTERKHPLYTEKTIAAGETVTTEFSVRVTPIYYVQSTPTGEIADEMLTVGVLGENTALASLEIQQVETIPTVWVLGDSTVTDGNTTLPFFPLQNYTGVGTGLTKYLRRDYAMVNEGEGGLNASDNNHFNMVKNRIRSGDYMYVEYGHNHKSDHAAGYKGNLDKYYNACHSVGAKLILVSPVQSYATWNATKGEFDDRWTGDDDYGAANAAYTAAKIAADAEDIAYVDLSATSLTFINKIASDNGNSQVAAGFYYQTPKDGKPDVSHPNDTGAENFADCFFKAAKEVTDTTQQAVLADLLDNMTGETPNLVPQSVMEGGIGGTAWPAYTVPSSEKYPLKIDDIVFNDDGTVNHVDVTKREAEINMGAYGAVIITIYNEDGTEKGKFYAVNQVDNSTGYGQQTVENFRAEPEGLKLEEGDTYSAVVVEADGDVQPVEGGAVYSAVYKPTDIVEHLLINERNEEGYENFDYYGATYDGKTTDYIGFNDNGWSWIGSAARTSYFNESGGTKYVTFTSDGGGSFYPVKNLAKTIGSSGRYMFSADLQYISGGGMTFKLVTGHDNNHRGGTEWLVLFTVDSGGKITSNGKEIGTISSTGFTNVQYILDIDRGTATVSVGGNEVGASAPVVIPLTGYQTTDLATSPSKLTQILLGEDRKAFSVSVANLMVAKLKDKELPQHTLSIGEYDEAKGFASVMEGAPTGVELSYVDGNAVVTADKADTKATLIEVNRKADGTLESAKATPLTFTDSLTQTTAATAGSTLMLWDTLSGMKPLAQPITAADTAVADSLTAALNTVVTVKAAAAESCAFLGWLDKDGKTVSEDAVYSFRLREDTELTPKFVEESGVEDITQFELSAKEYVKAVSGATVTMSIINAKDAQNAPVSKVTNEDVAWACNETGVTVDNKGVVTFDSDFSAGEDGVKKITIEGTLNEIKKTYTITAHLADYYEDFAKAAGTTIVDPGQTNGIVSNSNNPYSHLAVSVGGDNGSGGNITPIAAGNNFGYYSAGYNRDNYSLTFNPDKTISKFRTDAVFGAQTWAGSTPSKRGTDAVTLTVGNLTIVATPSNIAASATTGTDALTVTVSDGKTTSTATGNLKQLGWAKYEIEVGESNAVTVKITPNGGETETLTGFALGAAATKAVFSGSKTASFGLDNVEIFYAE